MTRARLPADLRLTARGSAALGIAVGLVLVPPLLLLHVLLGGGGDGGGADDGGGGGGEAAGGQLLQGPAADKVVVTETFTGEATYYGPGLPADAVTASGAPFDPLAAAAAHPTLPFGTALRVSRADGGASVVVEVNDRLPDALPTRVDLTLAAAEVLGMVEEGRIPVTVEVLAPAGR